MALSWRVHGLPWVSGARLRAGVKSGCGCPCLTCLSAELAGRPTEDRGLGQLLDQFSTFVMRRSYSSDWQDRW